MGVSLLQLQVEWANRTNVHLGGLFLTLVLAFGALIVPRRWVSFTLLVLACFIPSGQRVVILTLDFSFLRILVLVGWLRVAIRGEQARFRLVTIDYGYIGWVLVSAIVYTTLRGTMPALIAKLGEAFDAIGLYFLFRCLVQKWVDLDRLVLGLAILAIPVCIGVLIEKLTGRNLFSALGGVPEFTNIREGRMRCQGAFAHPILAGCFWAAVWPLIAAQWWAGGHGRAWAVIGSMCSVVIIAFSASSTPILAFGIAVLGGCSFLARSYLRTIRIALLASVVGLHLAMKGPVWHLIARVNLTGGSTGWHRYYLIDEAIRRFDEWWLLGTVSTAHWGLGLFDVTNQYVLEATHGGAAGLLLFLGVIALGFRVVGRAWRKAWPEPANVALVWALGVSLLTQCASFIGVAYFGQIWIIWYMVLACIGSAEAMVRGACESKRSSGLPDEVFVPQSH